LFLHIWITKIGYSLCSKRNILCDIYKQLPFYTIAHLKRPPQSAFGAQGWSVLYTCFGNCYFATDKLPFISWLFCLWQNNNI